MVENGSDKQVNAAKNKVRNGCGNINDTRLRMASANGEYHFSRWRDGKEYDPGHDTQFDSDDNSL